MVYRTSTDAELDSSTTKWMMAGGVLLLLMAAVFPFYRWYEPGARDEARTEQYQDLAQEGASVWEFNCQACHGLNGEGGIGPALNSQQFLQTATDAQIRTLIAVGIPGSQMSAYSLDHGGPLTSEQIKSVVTLIRSWEPTAPDNPDWRAMVGG